MKGAPAGGVAAIIVFIVFSWWSSLNFATPEGDQASALFGNFAIGVGGYAGVGADRAGDRRADRRHLASDGGLLSRRHRHQAAGRRVAHAQAERAGTDARLLRQPLFNRRNSGLTMMAMKGPDSPELAETPAGRRHDAGGAGWLAPRGRALKLRGAGRRPGCLRLRRRLCAFRQPCQRPDRRRTNPAAADAIIVLTGGQSRIDAALDLLKSGKGERLLISGVNPSAEPRGAAGRDRRRPQAVQMLRRHRPRRARHDRQCRGKRQMGRAARLQQRHPGDQQLPHAAQPAGNAPAAGEGAARSLPGRQQPARRRRLDGQARRAAGALHRIH